MLDARHHVQGSGVGVGVGAEAEPAKAADTGADAAPAADAGGYQAWWLSIDDKLMAKLERLAQSKLRAN